MATSTSQAPPDMKVSWDLLKAIIDSGGDLVEPFKSRNLNRALCLAGLKYIMDMKDLYDDCCLGSSEMFVLHKRTVWVISWEWYRDNLEKFGNSRDWITDRHANAANMRGQLRSSFFKDMSGTSSVDQLRQKLVVFLKDLTIMRVRIGRGGLAVLPIPGAIIS